MAQWGEDGFGAARQVRHGAVRRGLVRHVQVWHSRSGEVCWGMVRRVVAGVARFVAVRPGSFGQGQAG